MAEPRPENLGTPDPTSAQFDQDVHDAQVAAMSDEQRKEWLRSVIARSGIKSTREKEERERKAKK